MKTLENRPRVPYTFGPLYEVLQKAFPDHRSVQQVFDVTKLAKDLELSHEAIYRAELAAAKLDGHFGGVGRGRIERADEPEIAVDHEPGSAAHQFGRTRGLLANHRRREPGKPIVLPRFEVVLPIPNFDAKKVRLHAREIAGTVECGEALGREILHERIRLPGQCVVQVDDIDGAERPDGGLEGGDEIAANLIAERGRQQRMRLGLHDDAPQARPGRFRIEGRLRGRRGGGNQDRGKGEKLTQVHGHPHSMRKSRAPSSAGSPRRSQSRREVIITDTV